MAIADPYGTLGVARSASDAEVRAAYRRLVQLHHPDHNSGSPESARRFEEVQEAYAEVRRLRESRTATATGGTRPSTARQPDDNSDIGSRLAAMEAELKAARAEAMRQARRAAERVRKPDRPSDEELGYISTDDSFGKIFADAASDLSERLGEARESPVAKRVAAEARDSPVTKRFADLIDELGSKLTGDDHDKRS